MMLGLGLCWIILLSIAFSRSVAAADVSKDVKKVRIFEQGLLAAYQAFLKILHEHLKKWIQGAGKHTTDKVDMSELPAADRAAYALALTATRCMCDLLRAAPHFNFRNNIIDVLTPLMTGRYSPELLDMVCDAVVGVFKEDQDYAVR